MFMNTHTSIGGNRRLVALISLYASLCSVFALQLSIRTTSADLTASVSATEVSALVGDHGIRMEDLRSFQDPYAARRAVTRARHAAASQKQVVHSHQARTGR